MPGRTRGRQPTWILKLGGELLEDHADLELVAAAIAGLAKQARVVVVHGGGKEIDAALAQHGIAKVQVDGLRVTDAPTLGVVTSVLGGTLNTRLVTAARQAKVAAVGLTGADAGVAVMKPAPPFVATSGATVSLGLVGVPARKTDPVLLRTLLAAGFVPVIACLGATARGEVLNVNADVLAAHLAVTTGADALIISGGTSGVFDDTGNTIAALTGRAARAMIASGTANAGMIAKLNACRDALKGGVRKVYIVNGRTGLRGLDPRRGVKAGTGTEVTA
ncbi:MAG: acetylglutamate kinase [Vicinamibacterales bacterium]